MDTLAVLLYGIVSFFTPCVLPMVPVFLAGLTDNNLTDRKAVLVGAALFVAGFSASFMAMGATAGLIGSFLVRNRDTVRYVSGALIVLLGLYMLGVFGPLFQREVRVQTRPSGLGRHLRAFTLGAMLAFGWTPCSGPALGAALTLAARASTVWRGVFLLFVYSLGLGIPFMLTAAFMQSLVPLWRRISPVLPIVQKVAGALLIVYGAALWFGWLSFLPT